MKNFLIIFLLCLFFLFVMLFCVGMFLAVSSGMPLMEVSTCHILTNLK